MRPHRLILLSGNANRALTKSICTEMGVLQGNATVKAFSDGEIWVQIEANVRGSDVFVVQPTCTPADRHIMELVFMIDALKRASAHRITAVLPYYGYARQDRKDRSRVPISAKVVAGLLERAGANRVLTLDLHAAQIQGFFDIPVDHLFSAPVMIDYFKSNGLEKTTVVSPDAGGVERARALAKRLETPLAIIDKRRDQPKCRRDHAHHRRCHWPRLSDRRRFDRYGRDAGQGLRGPAEIRRPVGDRLRHPCRAVRSRGRAHRRQPAQRSCFHRFHSAAA